MACRLRIASPFARFGQPEVKLGVLPGYGSTQRLARLVGKGRALQLILTGEVIEAQEALRIGLVNQVVPAESLLARAQQILDAIAGNAPIATRLVIEAVNRGADASLPEALALERTLFAICASSEDKREGSGFPGETKGGLPGQVTLGGCSSENKAEGLGETSSYESRLAFETLSVLARPSRAWAKEAREPCGA